MREGPGWIVCLQAWLTGVVAPLANHQGHSLMGRLSRIGQAADEAWRYF